MSPYGEVYEFAIRIAYSCSNNQVEYEALLAGLHLLILADVKNAEVFGDSLLVIQQIKGGYNCHDEQLLNYLEKYKSSIDNFVEFSIQHIPWKDNFRANDLAQHLSGYRMKTAVL